jgi:hypothetical protein
LDQPVEDHRTSELLGGTGEPQLGQDLADAQAFPELIADMNGSGFAMVFGGDATRIDGDLPIAIGARPIAGCPAGGWSAMG